MVLENSRYPHDNRVRKEALALRAAGYDVEVLAPREPGRPDGEVIEDIKVSRFPLRDGGGSIKGTAIEYGTAALSVPPRVFRRLRARRNGVLHVHNPPDFFFPLLQVARRSGWATVFDHHDDAAGMMRARAPRARTVHHLLALSRQLSARAADLSIATNETQAALLRPHANALSIVRNAPPEWFYAERAVAPRQDSTPTLVFLGEIGLQDAVDGAVAVLHALRVRHQITANLLVIGDGPQRHVVEQAARRFDLQDYVTLTGWVPYEDVPSLLARCQVGIDTALPTAVNHGSTMMKIAEYLSVGLPVVATGLRETRTTIGNAGVLVDSPDPDVFADATAPLLLNQQAWQRQSDKAVSRAGDLRWERQAEVLLDAYPRPPTQAGYSSSAG